MRELLATEAAEEAHAQAKAMKKAAKKAAKTKRKPVRCVSVERKREGGGGFSTRRANHPCFDCATLRSGNAS